MTRRDKKWISVQSDGRQVVALDREAAAGGISRSEALRRALRQWTEKAMEEDETRITQKESNHRQVMNRLDYIVGMIRARERTPRESATKRDGQQRPDAGSLDSLTDGHPDGTGNGREKWSVRDSEAQEPHPSALDQALKRAKGKAE